MYIYRIPISQQSSKHGKSRNQVKVYKAPDPNATCAMVSLHGIHGHRSIVGTSHEVCHAILGNYR